MLFVPLRTKNAAKLYNKMIVPALCVLSVVNVCANNVLYSTIYQL
jgi:hypothetical protein